MNVVRETEVERLDRLERESRRRKWDSAIMVRSRDSVQAALTPPSGARIPREAADDDRPLLDLMAERLDTLERKAFRLETEVQFWQNKSRSRRILLGAVLVAVLCVAMGVPLVAAFIRSDVGGRGRAIAARPQARAVVDASSRELP
jgi:hypothetical protein